LFRYKYVNAWNEVYTRESTWHVPVTINMKWGCRCRSAHAFRALASFVGSIVRKCKSLRWNGFRISQKRFCAVWNSPYLNANLLEELDCRAIQYRTLAWWVQAFGGGRSLPTDTDMSVAIIELHGWRQVLDGEGISWANCSEFYDGTYNCARLIPSGCHSFLMRCNGWRAARPVSIWNDIVAKGTLNRIIAIDGTWTRAYEPESKPCSSE